jgi:energy-coupling factor transporter ATP-binding protein EcfA2
MKTDFDVVGSAGAALLAALGLALGSGCQGFLDIQDLELARGEANYASTEVGAVFAVAMAEAENFGQLAIDAHVAADLGAPITHEGCANVVIDDAVGADGSGVVRYDLSPCPTSSGSVVVAQRFEFTPPDSTSGGDGSAGDPPEVPPGTEADYTVGGAIDEADASMDVVYGGYSNGLLHATGSVSLTEVGGEGDVAAAVRIGALDYEGRLNVTGEWSDVSDGLAARMSFAGTFESATGVDWTVVADNVVFQPGCMDSLGGELLMIFDNPAGRVTVETVFDDVCDGCATLYVDGEEIAESCFGDGTTIGGVAQAGAE